MKKKLSIKLNHYIFILSLILISCVGVGFSSWITGPSNKENADVDASIGNIIDINNYIKYGNAEIFDYCRDGIVKDDTIVSNGEIIIPFVIRLNDTSDKILNHLPNGTTNIIISTIFENGCPKISKIFSDYLQSSFLGFSTSQGITNYNISTQSTEINGSNTYTALFNVATELNSYELYFAIKYSFAFPILDDFNTNIYQNLNRGKFWFNFKAEIKL